MSRVALISLLTCAVLAGCNRSIVVPPPIMPDQKPALSVPPASVMTPQGY